MLMARPITTHRLILRPECLEDSGSIHAMNCRPEVMRYIGDGRPWTSPLAEFIEQHHRAIERASNMNWGGAAVRLKESGEFLGLCWLVPSRLLGGAIELGYRYIPSAWGHGYATEVAKVVVRVGFEFLSLSEIQSVAHPQNVRSIRVLEKLGFRQTGHIRSPHWPIDLPAFTLRRCAIGISGVRA